MGFSEFLGNQRIVSALRAMLRRGRPPHALLFTGPRGLGKFTLARMFAQAANCERLADDFCGQCYPCRRIAPLADLKPMIDRGLAERGESADAATVERTPLILESHPDVWAIVPDPVRLRAPVARPMIRVGQLRAVQRAAYFKPEAKRRVFILDGADTMRWTDADIFLKILEEPPETATLILIAPRPDSLLPTIRSRCLQFHFAPVPAEIVEDFLKRRTKLKPAERKLAVELSQGAPGVALVLDLAASSELRRRCLTLIEKAVGAGDYRELFALSGQLAKQEKEGLPGRRQKRPPSPRLGELGGSSEPGRKESFENVLELFYSLLTDLLELSSGGQSFLPRNPDLEPELLVLSERVDREWLERAVRYVDLLEGRLRRNVNRQLGLDAMAVGLGRR